MGFNLKQFIIDRFKAKEEVQTGIKTPPLVSTSYYRHTSGTIHVMQEIRNSQGKLKTRATTFEEKERPNLTEISEEEGLPAYADQQQNLLLNKAAQRIEAEKTAKERAEHLETLEKKLVELIKERSDGTTSR